MKIIEHVKALARRLLSLFRKQPAPTKQSFTAELLLNAMAELPPMPKVKILNASIDLGGHGLYRVRLFKNGEQVSRYTQARVSLQTVYGMASEQAKIRHLDFVEIAVLSSEEPTS